MLLYSTSLYSSIADNPALPRSQKCHIIRSLLYFEVGFTASETEMNGELCLKLDLVGMLFTVVVLSLNWPLNN